MIQILCLSRRKYEFYLKSQVRGDIVTLAKSEQRSNLMFCLYSRFNTLLSFTKPTCVGNFVFTTGDGFLSRLTLRFLAYILL